MALSKYLAVKSFTLFELTLQFCRSIKKRPDRGLNGMTPFIKDKIQIGISSCLLGEKVRYDGGHKNSKYCSRELSQLFKFVPICPEMAIGLGAPRKTIRLVKDHEKIRVMASDESFDVTEALTSFSAEKVKQLENLGGYIFCSKSPTCGIERVLEYQIGTNNATKSGVGVFCKSFNG